MSSAAETRRRLIDAGRVAFAEKGHDGVSLQRDVLQPSGVSTGSFYHQFGDKTDLLLAVLEDGRERHRDHVEQELEGSADALPIERIARRITLWLEVIDSNESMFRILMRERNNSDERVRTLVSDFRMGSFAPLAQRLAASVGSRSETFDPQRAALFVRSLIRVVALDYVEMPKEERSAERDAIARDLAGFIIGGITTMAGVNQTSNKANQTGATR